jgi:hypothetical protein
MRATISAVIAGRRVKAWLARAPSQTDELRYLVDHNDA